MMREEISVTPEELYFLGKLLKAKYIDYDYIKAMGDIGQFSAVAKQKAYDRLEKNKYIEEEFSGEVNIAEDVRAIVDPLFFGEFESSINVAEIGEKAEVFTYRLHRSGAKMSLAVFAESGITIRLIDDDLLRSLIVSLLPDDYFSKKLQEETSVSKERITRVFSFKNNNIGIRTEIKVFFECEGQIYFSENDKTSVLTGEYFCEEAYRVLKGADSGIY